MKVKKSKILNSKTIAAAFLTIGLCIVINLLLSLLDNSWEKLFSAAGSIGSVIIGVGMFYLGWQQRKHLEQKISDEERKIIREHCHKTLDAIVKASYLCKKSGKDYEDRFDAAIYEIFKSGESAKIELNYDFADLIWRIHDFYLDLSVQHMDAAKEKRALGGEKALENRNKESALKNELENLYARYLKLPN